MTLTEERNHWRKQIEAGDFICHPLYEEYKANRESNLYRSTRQMERLFEYVMVLEDQVTHNAI